MIEDVQRRSCPENCDGAVYYVLRWMKGRRTNRGCATSPWLAWHRLGLCRNLSPHQPETNFDMFYDSINSYLLRLVFSYRISGECYHWRHTVSYTGCHSSSTTLSQLYKDPSTTNNTNTMDPDLERPVWWMVPSCHESVSTVWSHFEVRSANISIWRWSCIPSYTCRGINHTSRTLTLPFAKRPAWPMYTRGESSVE